MAKKHRDSTLEVRPYSAPNWFTRSGVELKRRAIERKGLPPWKQCLFLTLTLDPIIGEPVEAYERGKDRVRRFLSALRDVIGPFPWAWKLEFQDNGYAHWHLIVHYKKRIPRDCLCLIGQWWGLGRTNVERLRYKKFRYLFKYVSKGAFDGDSSEGLNLPEWLLDYENGGRMRFWQTGGGFYTKTQDPDWDVLEGGRYGVGCYGQEYYEPAQEKSTVKRFSYIRRTIRQQWRVWMRKAKVCIRDERCHYPIKSIYVVLRTHYTEFYQKGVNLTLRGKAALSGLCVYLTPAKIMESIEQWQKIQLNRITTISLLMMA
ncbi:rolling circle replication-associated protein [Cerasicoccus arenae]|uniref:Replication-associated protein ORF2/G2P domain-containing protein n=1 Tax=Cerasicoccus arenae TaxID=424488 RepID=A0A8J3DD68_9BACT|nr:hypothetical protein [Cerasicoccus arenae]MBK1860022.1 hypothetical protein [Cerasicoccus arenae]GHC12586.1 hypothetical protein GCM10007047_32440 [Cerasicoccus arenae]